MSPSGRIAADRRPTIDYGTLPPPIELDGSKRRLTLTDIDPYISKLVEQSYVEGKPYGQRLTSEEEAKEFARQCNAYARLRQPEISIGVRIHTADTDDGQAYLVRVSAGPKIRRKRKVVHLEVAPSEPATAE